MECRNYTIQNAVIYKFNIIITGWQNEANPIYWTNKWGVFMSRRTKYSYELRKEILRQ